MRPFAEAHHPTFLPRVPAGRDALVRAGVWVELATIGWMLVEATTTAGM